MSEPVPEPVSEPGAEIERYEAWRRALQEQETEFASYPEDVRLAALEYARGLTSTGEVVPQEAELDGEPQFIIIGAQQHGRSLIFASTSVRTTKFARRVEGVDRVDTGVGFARIPRMSILAAAELTSFEQYYSDDYRSALRTLLSEWDRKELSRQRAEQWAAEHPQLPPEE